MFCSAIYKSGLVARNFDWLYSRMADCIIHTDNTVGVGGGLAGFTDEFAKSGVYSDEIYKLLPFYLNDGVNSRGLCCVTLVTPNIVNKSIPLENKTNSVCSVMLVRYVLDNYNTITEAIDDLKNHIEVWFPRTLLEMKYNQHWLLADKNTAVILEIDESGTVVTVPITADRLCTTNFHNYNISLNSDGSVYTPYTKTSSHNPITTNHIHEFGAGLERFNILQASNVSSVNTAKNLLLSLKYSKTYTTSSTEDAWYTEFVNEEVEGVELTCDSEPVTFDKIRIPMMENYPNRSRDNPVYWNTTHSVVYDLKNWKMHVCSQEKDAWYELDITH